MDRPRLYIRSKRTTVFTAHVSMEAMGAAGHTTGEYTEGSVQVKLNKEDQLAKDLLKRSGLDYDLADLSKGLGLKLRARLIGVKQTPTLVDGSNPRQFYVGINEISQFAKSHANPRPD